MTVLFGEGSGATATETQEFKRMLRESALNEMRSRLFRGAGEQQDPSPVTSPHRDVAQSDTLPADGDKISPVVSPDCTVVPLTSAESEPATKKQTAFDETLPRDDTSDYVHHSFDTDADSILGYAARSGCVVVSKEPPPSVCRNSSCRRDSDGGRRLHDLCALQVWTESHENFQSQGSSTFTWLDPSEHGAEGKF